MPKRKLTANNPVRLKGRDKISGEIFEVTRFRLVGRNNSELDFLLSNGTLQVKGDLDKMNLADAGTFLSLVTQFLHDYSRELAE